MTYKVFVDQFPDDKACLDYLKQRFYPDGSDCPGCGRPSRFHRIANRTAYSCQFCGTQVYPTAGTVFSKSRTPLQLWFWAILLIASTHGKISAGELAQELGVSDRTAQRMRTRLEDAIGLERSGGETEVAAITAATPGRPPVWHGARRRA